MPLLFCELDQIHVSELLEVAFPKLALEPAQIVKSGPASTIGLALIVIVIVSSTSPIHGLGFSACNVSVIVPVSFVPGIYSGFNVLSVNALNVPVPFSVQ